MRKPASEVQSQKKRLDAEHSATSHIANPRAPESLNSKLAIADPGGHHVALIVGDSVRIENLRSGSPRLGNVVRDALRLHLCISRFSDLAGATESLR